MEEVAYVDPQRNVAVTFGEKDVMAAVKAKNKWAQALQSDFILTYSRREKGVMSALEEVDSVEALLAQVWLEVHTYLLN